MKFPSLGSETNEDQTYSDEAAAHTDYIDISCSLIYLSDCKQFQEDLRNANYIFTSGKKFYLCQLT